MNPKQYNCKTIYPKTRTNVGNFGKFFFISPLKIFKTFLIKQLVNTGPKLGVHPIYIYNMEVVI